MRRCAAAAATAAAAVAAIVQGRHLSMGKNIVGNPEASVKKI